jgi:predicted transposase YbfD/YdcC
MLERNTFLMRKSIGDHFAAVPDPRVDRTKRHKLQDILVIAVCGVICGAEHWTHVELFGKINEAWFRTFLDLPNGIPSHDTLGRVFAVLDPDAFEAVVQAFVADLAGSRRGKHIALDGKTLRGSFNQASAKGPLHMVSAWVHENHVAFGQRAVDAKSNEIIAIPELLKRLDVEEATVTIDAIGCQREIAEQIIGQGGDYVLALKANQQSLYTDVQMYMDDGIAHGFAGEHDFWETVEKGHGRLETRRVWTSRDVGWLQDRHDGPALGSLTAIERERQVNGPCERQRRYFISSHPGRCAQRLGTLIRNHWSVEVQLHWSLDVCFHEDGCRVRMANAAENFSRLRRIALMLLKQEKTVKSGIAGKRLRAGWDRDYLLKVLGI